MIMLSGYTFIPYHTVTRLGRGMGLATKSLQCCQRRTNASLRSPVLYAWNPENLETKKPARVIGSTVLNTSDDQRRVYVLGIGNLGRLFATSLAKHDARPPITLIVHRKTLLQEWNADPGLRITRHGNSETLTDFDVEWWTEDRPSVGLVREVPSPIRSLIITTKASIALPEVDRLRNYLSQESTIVFAQNGMSKFWPPAGPAYVKDHYPICTTPTHPNYLACVTRHGVTSNGAFRSTHSSVADLTVGPVLLNPSTSSAWRYLSGLLATAPHLHGSEAGRQEMWVLQLEKLVVNSVINPLTAFLRCRNGDLYNDSGVVTIMNSLVDEASAILQALVKHDSSRGVLEESDSTGSPSTHMGITWEQRQEQLLRRFSSPDLQKMLHDVGAKVRENTSSMLQDVRAGKPTEIRAFNGWLVDTAQWLGGGLDVRGHAMLIELIESGASGNSEQLKQFFSNIDIGVSSS